MRWTTVRKAYWPAAASDSHLSLALRKPLPGHPPRLRPCSALTCPSRAPTAIYKEGAVDRTNKPTADTEVWTFTKRVTDLQNAPPILVQVVILDDLIASDDKRVDVAPGEERRNLVGHLTGNSQSG